MDPQIRKSRTITNKLARALDARWKSSKDECNFQLIPDRSGGRATRSGFWFIPAGDREQFYEMYLDATERGARAFMIERRRNPFAFYYDIEHSSDTLLTHDNLAMLTARAQESVETVLGTVYSHPIVHSRDPNHIHIYFAHPVTVETAKVLVSALRHNLVENEAAFIEEASVDISKFVDSNAYSTGLRFAGSYKYSQKTPYLVHDRTQSGIAFIPQPEPHMPTVRDLMATMITAADDAEAVPVCAKSPYQHVRKTTRHERQAFDDPDVDQDLLSSVCTMVEELIPDADVRHVKGSLIEFNSNGEHDCITGNGNTHDRDNFYVTIRGTKVYGRCYACPDDVAVIGTIAVPQPDFPSLTNAFSAVVLDEYLVELVKCTPEEDQADVVKAAVLKYARAYYARSNLLGGRIVASIPSTDFPGRMLWVPSSQASLMQYLAHRTPVHVTKYKPAKKGDDSSDLVPVYGTFNMATMFSKTPPAYGGMRNFSQRVFSQTGEPNDYTMEKFNGWKYLPADLVDTPTENESAAIIQAHLTNVWCGGDQVKGKWVHDWFANIVQHPGIMNGSALVAVGIPGTGKSAVVDLFREVLGGTEMTASATRGSLGAFNGDLANSVLMIIEEIDVSDRHTSAMLRRYITDHKLTVNGKNMAVETIDSQLNVIVVTNHQGFVEIAPDQRRLSVYRMTNLFDHKSAEYAAYFDALFNISIKEWTAHLLSRDLSDFRPRDINEDTMNAELRLTRLPVSTRLMLDFVQFNYDEYKKIKQEDDYAPSAGDSFVLAGGHTIKYVMDESEHLIPCLLLHGQTSYGLYTNIKNCNIIYNDDSMPSLNAFLRRLLDMKNTSLPGQDAYVRRVTHNRLKYHAFSVDLVRECAAAAFGLEMSDVFEKIDIDIY